MNTLITGASSGIGKALAEAAAKRGDRLFICGRDKARLEAVALHCRETGATVRADIVDVTDEAAMRRWLESCDADAPLDRVFANAGVSTGSETEQNVRRTFAVNVGGVLNTVLPAIELMRRHEPRGGQIVITSSIAGYGPLKSCPAYAATKSCVKTWGLSLRDALRNEGIRVSVVCPGFVRSRITDKNTCPMPFFMEAPKAAEIILRRSERNVGLIAFPWPMRLASWGLSVLPQCVNGFLGRLLPKKA